MKIKAITNSSKDGTLEPHWPGWLQTRFSDHFAQIGTINTLRLSSSVRDVARAVMGSVPPDIERMCKAFIRPPQGVSDQAFIFGYDTDEGHVSGSIEIDKALQEYILKYPDQWELAKDSLSLWRSKGRHAAGYVISNEPIDELIPTITVDGTKVLDFTGPQVEACGAIKMDFLVVNCVKDVQLAIKTIQERYLGGSPKDCMINNLLVPSARIIPDRKGVLCDIWDLPQDPEVFRDLDLGKVETVFQFDSKSARQWLKYFNGIVHNVSDMAIFTALDRPGPLDYFVSNPDNPASKINMLVEYSRRARGLNGSPDIVKDLDVLCKETKGVMVYQESLMKVYQYFTDCTLAEAEEFRGNVGKKKKDKIDKAYGLFMERASLKVDKETAQGIWDSIITWSKYGFNKSHAKSYTTLSYACLWLKHHYPLEWWVSVLKNATKDELNDKFWMHCNHLVLLPDIKLSKGDWEIEGDKIRAPISILKGIGDAAHDQLSKSAPYRDLKHFCQSIVDYQKNNPVLKDKVEKDGTIKKVMAWGRNALDIGKIHSMISAGCLDSFFDEDTSTSQKVDAYHSTMKELYAVEKKKYAKSKKELPSLDALGRYQAKKSVLPLYGEDLRPLLIATGLPNFLETDGSLLRIKNKVYSKEAYQEVDTFDPVIGAKELLELEDSEGFLERYVRAGIVCYLEKKEKFNWGADKSKEAYKFFVEFGGAKRELVMWPDYNGNTAGIAKEVKAGSIIAVIVNKNTGKKDFAIRGIEIIRGPLDEKSVNCSEEDVDKVEKEA